MCHPSYEGKWAVGHDCIFLYSMDESVVEGVVTYPEDDAWWTFVEPSDLVVMTAAHILVAL